MRKDQDFISKYKKDQSFEFFLSLMNENLHKVQDKVLEDVEENYSTIHILGAPRSGTTLVSQLISEQFDIGYINNLIASFWKAPLFGISLSKKLLGIDYESSYQSEFGRTSHIKEPHEFGYFWNYHLKYEDFQQQTEEHEKNIDWDMLSLLLRNMTAQFENAIVFKSFLLGFHAARTVKVLPKTRFIYVQRSLADNVQSIFKMRKKMFGNSKEWGSIKPKQYKKLKKEDPYTQIVGQILFIELEYLNQLKNIPDVNYELVNYEDVCSDTTTFYQDIASKWMLKPRNGEMNSQHTELSSNHYDLSKSEVKKIDRAVDMLYDYYPQLRELITNRKQK